MPVEPSLGILQALFAFAPAQGVLNLIRPTAPLKIAEDSLLAVCRARKLFDQLIAQPKLAKIGGVTRPEIRLSSAHQFAVANRYASQFCFGLCLWLDDDPDVPVPTILWRHLCSPRGDQK